MTATRTASVLVIGFLDHPFQPGDGSVRPVAMQQTLDRLKTVSDALHLDLPVLCDEAGHALAGGTGG